MRESPGGFTLRPHQTLSLEAQLDALSLPLATALVQQVAQRIVAVSTQPPIPEPDSEQ